MKKMRKAVSILLAGCLVLGLSACGGDEECRAGCGFTDRCRAKGGWRCDRTRCGQQNRGYRGKGGNFFFHGGLFQ